MRTADTRKVVSFDGEGKRQSGNGVGIGDMKLALSWPLGSHNQHSNELINLGVLLVCVEF